MLTGQSSRAQLEALAEATSRLDLGALTELRAVVEGFERVSVSWRRHFEVLRELEGAAGFIAWARLMRAAVGLLRRLDDELEHTPAPREGATELWALAGRMNEAERRLAEIPPLELRRLRVAA